MTSTISRETSRRNVLRLAQTRVLARSLGEAAKILGERGSSILGFLEAMVTQEEVLFRWHLFTYLEKCEFMSLERLLVRK